MDDRSICNRYYEGNLSRKIFRFKTIEIAESKHTSELTIRFLLGNLSERFYEFSRVLSRAESVGCFKTITKRYRETSSNKVIQNY